MPEVEQALEVKNRTTGEFMAKRNVVGVAVGFKNNLGEEEGVPSVVVLVQQKKPLAALTDEDIIPREVNGTPTDVIEIGVLRAHGINPRQSFRPIIQPGASIAHFRVGAGTFGAVVRHRQTGERFILSNNHVLANSNDAVVGDNILQPGSLDGGRAPQDVVARLEAFKALSYIEDATVIDPVPDTPDPTPDDPGPGTDGPGEVPGVPDGPDRPTTPTTPTNNSGCDMVDAMVGLSNLLASVTGSTKRVQAAQMIGDTMGSQAAQVVETVARAQAAGATPAEVPFIAQQALDNLIDAAIARPTEPASLSDEILQIGRVAGTKAPTLGMTVAKFGRTTGYTEGRISLLDATVNVQYDTMRGTRTARFVSQVITSGMSKSGDSGSLVVDPSDNRAIGLLFAGSEFATIFTPIDRVLSYFNVEF
jgi:hypothetical protein